MNIHPFIYRLFSLLFGDRPIYTRVGPLKYLKDTIRSIYFVYSLIAGILLSFHPSVQDVKKRIYVYEQAGHYDQALDLARKTLKELLNNNADEISNLSLIIFQLEEKLLHLGYSEVLFNQDGKPKPKLRQILKILGMQHPSKKSMEEINAWAQDNLLRKGERWQKQTNRFEPLRKKIQPLLTDLGFIKGRSAHFQEYIGAIVHGALLPRVRIRLDYLVKQWKAGIRFPDIYFLSGERPLDPQHEHQDALINDKNSPLKIRKDWKLLDIPKTECEMIQLIWNQTELPEDMKQQVNVHFINAPMKNNVRPTTDDTVETWLKIAPSAGNYLAVTDSPYINRQDVVIRTVSPQKYGFDTVGPDVYSELKMAIVLDELARLIFILSRNERSEKIDHHNLIREKITKNSP